jgi:hypothetical protein
VRALAGSRVDLTADFGQQHLAFSELDFLPTSAQSTASHPSAMPHSRPAADLIETREKGKEGGREVNEHLAVLELAGIAHFSRFGRVGGHGVSSD